MIDTINKSEQSFPVKVSFFCYLLKHPFSTTMDLIRDYTKLSTAINDTFKDYTTEITILKGNTTWEIGSEFTLLYKKCFILYLRVIEYEETENLTRIKRYIYKTIPPTSDYYQTTQIIGDCTGEFSTYCIKWDYANEIWQTKAEQKLLDDERYEVFFAVDKFLSQNKNKKEQIEKVYFLADLEVIWNLISNLSLVQKISPSICDSVEIVSENEIKLIWNKRLRNGQQCYVLLKVININNNNKFKQIEYECVLSNPIVPKQTIIWRVEKTDCDFCILTFSHIYLEKLDLEIINSLSVHKKQILKTLKQYLEVI